MIPRSLLAAAMAVAAAGCASTPPSPPREEPTPVAVEINKSAARIEQLLLTIQELKLPEPKALPPGAGITLRFHGDARDLLARIAALRNLKFIVSGAPVVPLPVAINQTNASLEELLTLVAAQTANRGWVILDHHAITLEYRTQTGL